MQAGNFRRTLGAGLVVIVSMTTAAGQKLSRASGVIPANTVLRIMRAEDERRPDAGVIELLSSGDPIVRRRVALALGRIGDDRAVPALVDVLKRDPDPQVRQMTAFALGEIESPAGADALIAVLDDRNQPAITRARAVEALGKIGAALLSSAPAPGVQTDQPKPEDKTLTNTRLAILGALKFEADRRSGPDRLTILMGLTAALRARPEGAGSVITGFLGYSDPRIVADALNTMARLRLKDNNEQVRQLLGHSDPIVRANAARVIGAAEDKGAFDALLQRALTDNDLRVRVSAVRALGSLKDARAVDSLVQRGDSLLRFAGLLQTPRNELLEIAATLGRIIPNTSNNSAVTFLHKMHSLTKGEAAEVEIAFARIAPGIFENGPYKAEVVKKNVSWRRISARAQGLGAVKGVVTGAASGSAGTSVLREAEEQLRTMMNNGPPSYAIPDVMRAYASYKPKDLKPELLKHLGLMNDLIVRATAAELLGDLSLDEKDLKALADEFYLEITPSEFYEEPDAAIAILDTFAKQKSLAAYEEIKKGFLAKHYVTRRRAAELLKEGGVGDFSSEVGFADTHLSESGYRRALARMSRKVTATVVTSKGSFVIEFLPEQAPLTVDNFVQLARKGYFNGQTVPRVVPNFVIQTGDPRGDQNGGPGYQIRCEINEAPYDRGAVGMALSGKDTGGSQWFVTHSPQPHLDGGYTVFGRVISGLEVVDNIARGDTIRRIVVNER